MGSLLGTTSIYQAQADILDNPDAIPLTLCAIETGGQIITPIVSDPIPVPIDYHDAWTFAIPQEVVGSEGE